MLDAQDRLRDCVHALCSRECAGREAGSKQGAAARRYIADQLTSSGYTPHTQPVSGCRGANVWTQLGTAPYVLIGAHYDHLGTERRDNAYWGADDNAAAVAIMLELAARLKQQPLDAGIIVAAFDGEEPPHFLTDEMGSIEFCKHPPVPLDQVCLAIIMDLVGHAIGPDTAHQALANSLFVLGALPSMNRSMMQSRRRARCIEQPPASSSRSPTPMAMYTHSATHLEHSAWRLHPRSL